MVHNLAHVPFAALPSWDVTSRGTLISSDWREYAVVETTARGDTMRTISREVESSPIPESERRDSLAALRSRIDDLPIPVAQVQGVSEDVRELRLPRSYPAVARVHMGRDGRLWVQRWAPPHRGGWTFWDVFDFAGDGSFLGVVGAPVRFVHEPAPVFSDGSISGVVKDEATDEQFIVRMRFR